MFRSGLKTVILSNPLFEVVAEASSGVEVVRFAKEKGPDIIIMDINMPGIDGIEATKQIKEYNSAIKVLILTMHTDEAYLKEGLKVGASGYVLKKAVDRELLSAIQIVLQGENYIYPTLIPSLYRNAKEKPSESGDLAIDKTSTHDVLSPREKEILKYIVLGYTHQEIGETLFISPKTVDTHKSRIMEKMNVKKRSDLVRYALKHDLIH